jgi:cytochrome c oxidase subunit 1
MSANVEKALETHGGGHHEHGHDHHELSFWRKYVFSTDHKMIGIQYGITALLFLLFGFSLMGLMRWQLAYPDTTIPFFGKILTAVLGEHMAPKGVMSADLYNSFGAMHGTIMVFLGIVPLGFAAFGNFVMPLQVGAPDMAFPRLNMASYWSYLAGGIVMLVSFVVPGGAAKSGWTSYPPLAGIADVGPNIHIIFNGQTLWIIGMVLLISSSLLGSVNVIATVVQLRAKGMTWMRLPFFVWAQFVTAFLLLLAFPPLEAAGVMQLMDRVAGTSFFMPSGLVVNGQGWHGSGGGSPLLWQHLFWFLGHPEVYVMILPGLGIVAEVLANNARKPLWGYRSMVWAVLVLGFLSFLVWAHHMYLTGMDTKVSAFFQTTTIIISVPSVIILTCLIISLYGGSIRFNTPMLFAIAFLPMFGIGGLTGIPLAFNATDVPLHDTYYIIGHFHYVVAPGTLFALFAGVYFWYPKATGRMMSEFWGHVHFWPTFILMNCIFMPMFLQGFAGVHRRWYSGGIVNGDALFEVTQHVLHWNTFMSWASWLLAVAQIPFILNFFLAWKYGHKSGDNPWHATTLDWQTPTPPPHGNFTVQPEVYRGPYEYSVPGYPEDYLPQDKKLDKKEAK